MGVLHYATHDFPMEDRLLAHLQVVIALKLRRGENFFLAWVNSPDAGSGRHVVWIDNGVPIFCEYENGRIPRINRDWIDTLTASAATNYGLQISPEGTVQPLSPVDLIPIQSEAGQPEGPQNQSGPQS